MPAAGNPVTRSVLTTRSHREAAVVQGPLVIRLSVAASGAAEHFQQFFEDPSLQAFIVSTGAASVPPEVIVSEAVSSADQF